MALERAQVSGAGRAKKLLRKSRILRSFSKRDPKLLKQLQNLYTMMVVLKKMLIEELSILINDLSYFVQIYLHKVKTLRMS